MVCYELQYKIMQRVLKVNSFFNDLHLMYFVKWISTLLVEVNKTQIIILNLRFVLLIPVCG